MINGNHNPNPIIIHGGLVKRKNKYSFFIWGEQKKHKKYVDIEPFKYPFLTSPFELKLALFRHDVTSFYGTFLETSECHIKVPLDNRLFYSTVGNVPVYHVPPTYENHLFPINGVDITVEEIPNYLPTLIHLDDHQEWQLADDFIFFQELVRKLLDELTVGNFIPNINGNWEIQNFDFESWSESVPRSFLSLQAPSHSFVSNEIEQASIKEFSYVFIDNYLKFKLKNDPTIKNAFKALQQSLSNRDKTILTQIENELPITRSSDAYQHFLENIGAIEVAPFKLGIRVDEDKKSDKWHLTMFIHDRNDPTLMFDIADLDQGNHPWMENPITFYKDTIPLIKKQIPQLKDLSLTTSSMPVSVDAAYDLITTYEEVFKDLGITILVPSWWNKKENHFAVTLEQKDFTGKSSPVEPILNWQSIAEFDYSISVAGVTVSETEFQQLVDRKQSVVKLRGKWVVWDVGAALQVEQKIQQYKEKKQLTYIEAYQLSIQETENDNVVWEANWNKKINRLLIKLANHSWEKAPLPIELKGSLRPYQHDGYSWLLNMRKIGFGACLADDMGLGKTIQTIAYLLQVKEASNDRLSEPFLLICPTSLIGNWEYELQSFAPSLKVYVHHGQHRSSEVELACLLKGVDIIITSYALAVRDQPLWLSRTWQTLILDEAQHVKNFETKQRRSIKQIEATHRIALTGTPIENRLKELWSIIDLLNDRFLGSYHQFYQSYIKEIEGLEENNVKLEELKKMISPFLLRRTKRDKHINLQLPSKNEIVHRVGLTIEQASLYQAVINELFNKIDTVSEMERRALILSSLTKLKQICNHPAHYLKDNGELENRSEKWEELLLLTETISFNNEKALIFTQYKEMGTIIKKGLEKQFNTEIPFLHGSLQRQKREQLISDFMNGQAPFFILSLKAGGVGLNLTAANHVIHYDRWWNPAVENQATDRAYRIGQTEDVTVHKLLTKGTLEEKIHAMLEKKQHLSDQILNTNENKLSELSKDDLEQFLNLRFSNI